MSRTGALPEPLALQRHLDASTVAELEEFARFWSPHFKSTDGRGELVEELQRVMADENVVYAKVDLLSEKVRAVLLRLLRKTHYVSDLQGLFRGSDGLEMEYYEAEAALTALARRGFVRQSRGQDWLQHGRSSWAIPRETALVMRGLAGADRRPLGQVFLHAGFRPSHVETAASEPYAPLPDDVEAALDDLPPRLGEAARETIARFGGLLTRHEFGAVFHERGIRWDSAAFLHEFGRRGLGTVGHLDLRAKGIGVDDDALFFFAEVVERFVAARRARPLEHDRVLAARGDLMSDVGTALAEIADEGVKVSKEGKVYKAARARLADKLQLPGAPLLEPVEVAERVLAVVRGLRLAETGDDGFLALTEEGEAWPARPLLEKVRQAYDLLPVDRPATLRSRHLRRLHALLVEQLTGEEEPGWWPDASAALLARNRYLLELDAEEGTSRTPLTLRHAAVTELGRAAHQLLVHDLFALGLVDVALRGDAPVGVRLSRLGERLLRGAEEVPARSTKPLVVNPDFEVLVLPEGDVDDLLHALDRIAVRERSGQVAHYRLERARLERAAASGFAPEDALSLLEEHARAPLPQNVVYSVRSWGSGVKAATLEPGVLFVASEPGVVETVRNHPALKEYVVRVLEPDAIFFREEVLQRPVAQELRALGIYLR